MASWSAKVVESSSEKIGKRGTWKKFEDELTSSSMSSPSTEMREVGTLSVWPTEDIIIPKQIELWRQASVTILQMKSKVNVSARIAYRTRFRSGREGSSAANGDCATVIAVRR